MLLTFENGFIFAQQTRPIHKNSKTLFEAILLQRHKVAYYLQRFNWFVLGN